MLRPFYFFQKRKELLEQRKRFETDSVILEADAEDV